MSKFSDVPSIPYRVDFDIPVHKVVCGNYFAGLLTSEGQIFTWGCNNYGQLGIQDDQIYLVQRPNQIQLLDVQSSNRKIFAKDL